MRNVWSDKANWPSQSHFSWFSLSYKWNTVLNQFSCWLTCRLGYKRWEFIFLNQGSRGHSKEQKGGWEGGEEGGNECERKGGREGRGRERWNLRLRGLAAMLEQRSPCQCAGITDGGQAVAALCWFCTPFGMLCTETLSFFTFFNTLRAMFLHSPSAWALLTKRGHNIVKQNPRCHCKSA